MYVAVRHSDLRRELNRLGTSIGYDPVGFSLPIENGSRMLKSYQVTVCIRTGKFFGSADINAELEKSMQSTCRN